MLWKTLCPQIWNYYKFITPEEINQFFEGHKLPKLTKGETDNLNSPIAIKEIESTTNNLPKKNSPGPVNSTIYLRKNWFFSELCVNHLHFKYTIGILQGY